MTEQQLLIPMAVGERLSKLRKDRRRSLESCAAALKVPVDTLMAIESDRLQQFAPVYRKGYVQAYARHLGLEEQEIAAMVQSLAEGEPELKSVFPESAPVNSGDRWLRAASYVLASLLVGTLAWQLTHEAVRLYQGEEPGLAVEAMDGPDNRDLAVPSRREHVNASIASLEELGKTRAGNGDNPARAAWSALKRGDEANATALPEGEHRLQVVASGDSWIEIFDANGKQLEMDLVRGGSERAYQGLAPFRVLFGRASAVDLFMDGRKVDLSGATSGDVLQMSLDEGFQEVATENSGDQNG
jgi:cytoskeleton protein RodZ